MSSTDDDLVNSGDAPATNGVQDPPDRAVLGGKEQAVGASEIQRGSVIPEQGIVGERRAVRVPVPNFPDAGGSGGGEGKEGTRNRAGFHSYDETHQV